MASASKLGRVGRGASRPVGLQQFSSLKLTRRSFLAGTASLPTAAEAAFAASPVSMELEFDLSTDGRTLIVREFPRSASNLKLDPNPIEIPPWHLTAAAFGPSAWFDLVIDANDESYKHLLIRKASYGGAVAVTLDFLFSPVIDSRDADKRYVKYWALNLTTDLWGGAARRKLSWASIARPFREFVRGTKQLNNPVDAANANARLSEIFDRRVAANERATEALQLSFDKDCLWHLSRKLEFSVSSFDGLASAGAFTLGWYEAANDTPFLAGFATGKDDRVIAARPFRIGGTSGASIDVHDFTNSGDPLEWEVRQVASPLVPSATETFAKLTFGAAELSILDDNDPTTAPISAASLFVTECRLPTKDQRVRRTVWGDVAQTAADAPAELRTPVGRLGVNAPEPVFLPNEASHNPPTSVPSGAPSPTQNSDTLIASGDRSGAQDASIWAVFDRTMDNASYAARRIAVDVTLLWSDLALPDVSHSALTFDAADLRLIYEDGEPMTELSTGEFPRQPASSYVWVGPLGSAKTDIAHFDLSRATLTVAREVDLVKLRFRFLDLKLALTPWPELRPAHADCRVIDLGNNHFRDDRPVLVAEFDPQHVFEEALFRQNIPLPDVAGPVDVTLDGVTNANQDRNAIIRQIDAYAADPDKLLRFRLAVQNAKEAKEKGSGGNVFADFCRDFGNNAISAALPPDQQIYVGPFALDPDTMALARRVERTKATATVTASIDAMFARITDFIAAYKNTATLAPAIPTDPSKAGPDDYYLANALRNEAVLEQQEPVYGVFRDYYRSEMIREYFAKEAAAPATLDSIDVEFFAGDKPSAANNRPAWPPNRQPSNDPRPQRGTAVRAKFVAQIVGDDPVRFSDLSDARLAQPSRLAFHVNCAPAPGATAEEAGLHHGSGASPQAANSGRFTYPALAFTFGELTNWSRHEPAVTLRARKLFNGNASGIVPPIGARAANLADGDVLAYQGFTRGPVTAEQRLGEIRQSLAKKPTSYETAIEIPARLTLSTAQDAIWFDKRKLPWQLVYENAGLPPAVAPKEAPGSESVMIPGDPVRRSHEPLWTARLALDGIEPSLRVVDSPDLRPNALTWLKPNDVRQIGQGAPPRGPFAPWFMGPEQMDATTLTAADVNAKLPAGAQIAVPANIVMTVTGAAAGNNGVVRLTVDSTVGVATGATVVAANIGGTAEANGTFTATMVDATHIELQGTKFVHAWTSGGTLTIEPLCNPPLRDRIWRMLRMLCGRKVDRDALDGLRLFRSALDAYDRHELVLLSSAYGLPVIGKRKPREGDPAGTELAGGLVANSGQIEPGEEFPVLDADDAQAIQRPQPLRVRELWLSALGGSFVHDTQFLPSAGANDLWGGKIFDGFSIERWRAEIVLGRDIVGEVVYKGYLFPLGHRASLVKLTERLFLRSETLGVKAVLVQRIFVRVGRKTQVYPAVGQPFSGRLWCARDVSILTVQTPDLQDPYQAPTCDINDPDCNPENPVGGRINLGGAAGLAFWPRVNETDEGLIKFDLTIDGAETSMPLIFVDNIAATTSASLQSLVETYRRWPGWCTRRTVALREQNVRYAQETKTGDCTLKTQSLVVNVHGLLNELVAHWNGDLDRYETTAILEGAEQPPFYPSVETATVRLDHVERFSGGKPRPVDVQYDGRYVRFGFSTKSNADPNPTNPLEIFLNLRTCIAMSMGNSGDRSGAVGRPDSNVVALGRGNGPIGASGAVIFELSAPASADDHIGSETTSVPVCDGAALIPPPTLGRAFPELCSLADYFDPQNPYLDEAKRSGTNCAPAIAAPLSAAGHRAAAAGPADAIRKLLGTFFSDSAKILGVVTLRDLLQFLGFNTSSLLGSTPVLRETLQFGSGASPDEDAQLLVQDIHAHVLAPLKDAVGKLQTQWQTVSDNLKSRFPGRSGVSLAQVFPEIDSGLHDLGSKLDTAEDDNDPIGLFVDLAAVYESARAFAAVLDRIASNPVARLQAAAVGAVQAALTQFLQSTTVFSDVLTELGTNLRNVLDGAAIGPWLKTLIGSQDTNGQLSDTLTLALVPPDIVSLAQQAAQGIGSSLDAINSQLKKDLEIDISNFFEPIIDEVLAGSSLDAALAGAVRNFRTTIKSQVDQAVSKAEQAIQNQLSAAQQQASFIITTELDAFAQSIAPDSPLSAGLQDAYRAIAFVVDLIGVAKSLRDDIKAGDVHKSIGDLAALADMILGVGDEPLKQLDQSLNGAFKDLKAQAAAAAADLTPTTGPAFSAEVAACQAYEALTPVQKKGVFPSPAMAANFEPMITLDAVLVALKAAQTSVVTSAAYLSNPTNLQKIQDAAAAVGVNPTPFLNLVRDAQTLVNGSADLGLVGDASALYCAFVKGLARTGAAVTLIQNTSWDQVNKDLVGRLTEYEQACGQSAGAIGEALASALKRIVAFIEANPIIVGSALLAGALDGIAQISGLDGTIIAQLNTYSADWKKCEQDVVATLIKAIDVLIRAVTKGAAFAGKLTTTLGGTISALDTPLLKLGLSLEPQKGNVKKNLDILTAKLGSCANYVEIPQPGTASPKTIVDLLAAPVVNNGSPTTVQSLFIGASQTYQQLSSDLHNAEAAVFAEWRALQARANGLPQYLQRAVVVLAQPPLQKLSAAYAQLLDTRKTATDEINSPLLSLQARRALFVAPVYVSPPGVDINDPTDDDQMLQALENNDRLAEEVGVLRKIAAYTPPAPSASDTIIGNFVRFADSWVASGSTNKAAPLQIADNIQGLAAEVLTGEILALIDVAAFRDAIVDAIAQLVPTKAVFSYDFASTVTEPPDEDAIFQAQVGAPFALTTRIEVDLLNQGKTEFAAAGTLGPFAIKLVGSIINALTLRFGGASFASRGGAAPRFDVSYGSYEIGPALDFVQELQSYLTPSDGAGFHIGPLDWALGIEAGYGVNLGSIGIGEVSFFNIIFDVSADLPFTDAGALFKTSLGTRLAPFTMSVLPYAGSGYFSIFSAADGIRGFEASFLFGGGGSLQFGPLEAQVQIQVGAFIKILNVGGVNTTEIAGTFLAAGSMTIWIFNFTATLYVSLAEDNGNMYGEAIFTFSFSAGFIDYCYSVTASHNQPQLGKGDSKQSELEPGLLGPFTRFAARDNRDVLSDADDPIVFAAANAVPTGMPPPPAGAAADADAPDIVSKATCQSENWEKFASYFDFDLVQ